VTSSLPQQVSRSGMLERTGTKRRITSAISRSRSKIDPMVGGSGRTNFEKVAIVKPVKETRTEKCNRAAQTVPKIVPMLARLGANQRESGFRKLLVRLVTDLVE
jgi:hypothetical protein